MFKPPFIMEIFDDLSVVKFHRILLLFFLHEKSPRSQSLAQIVIFYSLYGKFDYFNKKNSKPLI